MNSECRVRSAERNSMRGSALQANSQLELDPGKRNFEVRVVPTGGGDQGERSAPPAENSSVPSSVFRRRSPGSFRIRMWVAALILLFGAAAWAQDKGSRDVSQKPPGAIPTQDWISREDNPRKVVTTLEILLLFTILSLAPAIVVMMTSFTRIVIVLSFVRRALATQELPPNQVIIGLSLLLTFMVMSPTFMAIKRDALDPYTSEDPKKQISQAVAIERTVAHMRAFMFQHAREKDVRLFMSLRGEDKPELTQEEVPTDVLIPAFVISELRRAFIMGFAIFLPFMIIDMVVASTLISMGMLVLPPILISLPFKILLFILVDGWHLVVGSLVQSFYVETLSEGGLSPPTPLGTPPWGAG